MARKIKIQQKVQLFIMGPSILIYFIALGYISFNSRKSAYEEATKLTDMYVSESAKVVKSSLDVDMSLVKTLSNAFLIYEDLPDEKWQDLFLNMYQNVLANNPHIYNLWDSWELSVIDPSWQKTHGRLAMECWRENGTLKQNKSYRSMEKEAEVYDKIIKPRRIQSIWEPYFDIEAANKSEQYLMTTLNSPILKGDTYIGIVAIDITLDKFQALVEKLSPFTGSYAFMISNGGIIAGHPKKELLNKNIMELLPEDCKNNNESSLKRY